MQKQGVVNRSGLAIYVLEAQDFNALEFKKKYVELLSKSEKTKYSLCKREDIQHRYLFSRVLVRLALSHFESALSPGAWEFGIRQGGKPFVCSENLKSALYFNLSHAGTRWVCAVSRSDVGIDVENIKRQVRDQDLARRYFHVSEIQQLAQASADQKKYLFFNFWTLKEAYFKALGTGISLPLGQIHFDLTGEAVRPFGLSKPWVFTLWALTNQYRLAICTLDPVGGLSPSFFALKPEGFLSDALVHRLADSG